MEMNMTTYDRPDYTLDVITGNGVTSIKISWKLTSNYPGRVETATFTSATDAQTFPMYAYGVALS
jgi:hypothetical protein